MACFTGFAELTEASGRPILQHWKCRVLRNRDRGFESPSLRLERTEACKCRYLRAMLFLYPSICPAFVPVTGSPSGTDDGHHGHRQRDDRDGGRAVANHSRHCFLFLRPCCTLSFLASPYGLALLASVSSENGTLLMRACDSVSERETSATRLWIPGLRSRTVARGLAHCGPHDGNGAVREAQANHAAPISLGHSD